MTQLCAAHHPRRCVRSLVGPRPNFAAVQQMVRLLGVDLPWDQPYCARRSSVTSYQRRRIIRQVDPPCARGDCQKFDDCTPRYGSPLEPQRFTHWFPGTAVAAPSPAVFHTIATALVPSLAQARGTHVSPRDPLVLPLAVRQPLLRDALAPVRVDRA